MALKVDTITQGIHVTDLSFAYPDGTKVLEEVSFTVAAGSRALLAGFTGSGKSTLLRCLKPELTPHGRLSGDVFVGGQKTREFNPQFSVGHVGFVMQDPKQQIVMDTVKAELAFGLENLGVPSELIQRRVAEIANYFGINAWVERPTTELSGGEAQIVNLAAVIAMQPRTLLLDEPTAMLDPISSREFIELVERVNDEMGITILLVEHQQEDLLNTMNQVLYLKGKTLAFDGRPREFAEWLHGTESLNRHALPTATRLFFKLTDKETAPLDNIPLGVRDGRWWLWQHKAEAASVLKAAESLQLDEQKNGSTLADVASKGKPSADTVLEARNIWYRFSKEGPYLLRSLSLTVKRGSSLGIVGANASGKSTLLSLLAGIVKPQHGKVLNVSHLHFGMLPQDPTALFACDSVLEDLMEYAQSFAYNREDALAMLARVGLTDKKERHPFDLSGGEQQKLALAKLLLTNADVLLLDEPTKGLDSVALIELRDILRQEINEGKTIIIVSHDLEFVASTVDECLMLFDGETVGRATTREFFAGNMFYTTALHRITQGILENSLPVLSIEGHEESSA